MATVLDFKAVNKTQQVHNYIEGLIRQKILCPGDCIMPENKLAQKMIARQYLPAGFQVVLK